MINRPFVMKNSNSNGVAARTILDTMTAQLAKRVFPNVVVVAASTQSPPVLSISTG